MSMTMTFLVITAVFLVGVVVVRSWQPCVRGGSPAPVVRRMRPGSRFQSRGKTFIVHAGPVLPDGQASANALNKTDAATFLNGSEGTDRSGRASISSDGDINLVY